MEWVTYNVPTPRERLCLMQDDLEKLAQRLRRAEQRMKNLEYLMRAVRRGYAEAAENNRTKTGNHAVPERPKRKSKR